MMQKESYQGLAKTSSAILLSNPYKLEYHNLVEIKFEVE